MLKVIGPRPFLLVESTLTSNHMCVINTNSKQRWYHGDNYGFGDCVGLHSTGCLGAFSRATRAV